MNIVLIGMAGSGKSLIGQRLASKLKYKFIDVDEIIQQKTHFKLQDYIDQFGDDAFLKIEEETTIELLGQNCVIAPGGSIIYSPKAMTHLKSMAVIVFMDVSLEVLKSRTKDIETRGIVYLKRKSYDELFTERLPLYRKYADIIVKIDDLTFEQATEKICKRLESEANEFPS